MHIHASLFVMLLIFAQLPFLLLWFASRDCGLCSSSSFDEAGIGQAWYLLFMCPDVLGISGHIYVYIYIYASFAQEVCRSFESI